MLTAAAQRMIDLDDLSNPITWRFNLTASWGATSQEITMDVPELAGLPAESLTFGARVWSGFISTLITRSCTIDFVEMVRWKSAPLPLVGGAIQPAFQSTIPPTSRSNSGMFVFHTGHSDSFGRRRFSVPNMPRTWAANGLLTEAGKTALMQWASMFFMGAGALMGGFPLRWLLAYPDVVEPTLSNLRGVAFRDVQYVRTLHHTEPAPDHVPVNWP